MEAADGWLIAHLRALPRRRRLEELLLDRRLRGLDVNALADHLDRLETEVADLRERLENREPERPPGHVLFLPTPAGYAVVEADEPPPPVGRLLLLEDGCFRVLRVGRSPFPRDRRPCLFLEAVPSGI
ncbi:MAG: hypothetical protein ACXWYO_08045 [Gaiellaceae bacterium]